MKPRRRPPKRPPLPRRDEFYGDDLAWFDAVQPVLLDHDRTDLALDLFVVMPDDLDTYLERHFS